MKCEMIHKLREHHGIARLGTLLVAMVLIVGTVSCGGGGGGATYSLTMAVAPGGSGTAIDLTNTSPYSEGTAVSIKAVANTGYRFANWSAPAGAFGNVTTAMTNFTMPAQNVTITANFVSVYDLTISSSTGGNVTTPGEGTFTYDAGTVVNLVATPGADYYPEVSAGHSHAVGLRADGTVVAVGLNTSGQCDVGGWTDIIQVSAGAGQTVGLKSDGTVVAVGDNTHGQCNVGNWTDIIQVDSYYGQTVGLKSDGTVVAVGDNTYGQCNVGGWTNITQVISGGFHVAGLKADGTVVAVGHNHMGQCNVGGWDLI
jgi:hypothetical protein